MSFSQLMITIAVMICIFMSSLDISIVNVAIPTIRGAIGISISEATWISTSYMLANVIVMPAINFLTSMFGKTRCFFAGVLLFGIGSFMCGFSWNLESIIIFRALQGIGGGALIPLSQAILRENYPPHEQAKAMSFFGIGIVLGPGLGPTIGGWITDNISWNWIFYINVPFVIIDLILIYLFILNKSEKFSKDIDVDYIGLITMAIGLGALQIMLEKGQEYNWFSSQFIVNLAIISLVFLTLFAIRELTCEKPAVNLKLLKNFGFSNPTIIQGIFGMGLFAGLFLIPILFQESLGYSATEAGIAMIPRSISMAMFMPIAGKLYNRTGPKKMIMFASALISISFLPLSFMNLDTSAWDLFWPQFFQGMAFAFIFVSLSTVALMALERKDIVSGAGIFNLVRVLCGSIGTAVFATELENYQTINKFYLTEHVITNSPYTVQGFMTNPATLLNPYTTSPAITNFFAGINQVLLMQGASAADLQSKAYTMLNNFVDRQALIMAFNNVFFLLCLLFCVSFILSLFIVERKSSWHKEI
ncbi:MFS transporter, DHA2 family, multidrug resistance protein [Thermodesulfobium acidiphilum]|uniref:MFS transporter, DHA2 family, multidrug resistance protein n=1 Tax=Thermodesulfobium acidiphilum TaxID=1794699 RepID=A0A2R4W0Q5_THEAF|nr:DHA2 family efflux MFS transporter permease subunit [Thermodesulfobium acidiphilum]AWB10383.1 MFS transporter, DHA2 family, multidrug resistance protein [Thermodesulfobium acidiphilum]